LTNKLTASLRFLVQVRSVRLFKPNALLRLRDYLTIRVELWHREFAGEVYSLVSVHPDKAMRLDHDFFVFKSFAPRKVTIIPNFNLHKIS
jgi:hypothetical protein